MLEKLERQTKVSQFGQISRLINMYARTNPEKGYSSVESLISFSLFLFLILSSLQFFGFVRKSFFKLKASEEVEQAALSALEKMKIDILRGGQGLLQPIRLGLCKGIEENSNTLIIQTRDKNFELLSDLVPGQTKIHLKTTRGLRKGREIYISDPKKGEVKHISSISTESIVVSSPLLHQFLKEKTKLFSLKKISLFLDERNQTIRRKVNNSSPQPLLEDVISFDFHYEETKNIIQVRLALKSDKEKRCEFSVFTKNMALALIH